MKTFSVLCFVLLLVVQESSSQISYQDILSNAAAKDNLSSACSQTLKGTTILSPWFWLMVDASFKIPSGVAKGNFFTMGDYDECLSIEQIPTKFCKTSININLSIGQQMQNLLPVLEQNNTELVGVDQVFNIVQTGLYFCVVKLCTAEELDVVFNGLVKFDDEQCWASDSEPALDGPAILAIVIFSIFLVLTITSTAYDVHVVYNEQSPAHPITTAFSLYTNARKLFYKGNSQQLLSLNGIKSLSMLWVVLGHVFMAYTFVPLDNYLDALDWIKSVRSQYISGATVSVDSFLLVGGFLTVYLFQASMDKGTKFNVPFYYFHRYVRLTPALAAMLLAHATLFNYLGSGPVWQNTDTYLSKACKEYWWSTLLYVQNYVNPNGICIPQSWYLSVDMQLFLISPLILILMRKWPIWGYISLSVVSILSIVASFLIGWYFKLGGQMTANTNGNLNDYMKYYYMPTHTRMVPYLFGIMLGHAIYKLKASETRPKLNFAIVILGWIISLGSMAVCIYVGSTLQFTEYDRVANSFFIALMRPIWAIAICWVVFACVMDYGGPVDKLLSLSIFQILSRLSYSIYLVHYSFIFMGNFSTRTPLHFTEYSTFHKFWGDLAISCVIAVIWTLVFESPVIVLEKLLLGRGSGSRRVQKTPLV